MKTANIAFILLLLGVLSVNAQTTFTLKVSCEVKEPGTLYVSLVDSKTFKETGGYLQQKMYKISSQQKQTIEFQFNDIPKGIYGIRFFIDQNNNGKVDIGTFGSKEPWGMTWIDKKPTLSKPKFEQMCHGINADYTFQKVIVEK